MTKLISCLAWFAATGCLAADDPSGTSNLDQRHRAPGGVAIDVDRERGGSRIGIEWFGRTSSGL